MLLNKSVQRTIWHLLKQFGFNLLLILGYYNNLLIHVSDLLHVILDHLGNALLTTLSHGII
jgi:hypothetical protein